MPGLSELPFCMLLPADRTGSSPAALRHRVQAQVPSKSLPRSVSRPDPPHRPAFHKYRSVQFLYETDRPPPASASASIPLLRRRTGRRSSHYQDHRQTPQCCPVSTEAPRSYQSFPHLPKSRTPLQMETDPDNRAHSGGDLTIRPQRRPHGSCFHRHTRSARSKNLQKIRRRAAIPLPAFLPLCQYSVSRYSDTGSSHPSASTCAVPKAPFPAYPAQAADTPCRTTAHP